MQVAMFGSEGREKPKKSAAFGVLGNHIQREKIDNLRENPFNYIQTINIFEEDSPGTLDRPSKGRDSER
jgi:hypothetical protein